MEYGGVTEKLSALGCHVTRQRLAVFEYLNQTKTHPTAEEVFLAVKRKLSRISLATVYKNLEALVACGAISKLSYGDAAARYDVRTDHHYHTRCLGCSEVLDIEPTTAAAEIFRQTGLPSNFTITDYRLEILGFCAQCQQH
jgi:Fur family transcriptional regulator, peroxide stress response regulator